MQLKSTFAALLLCATAFAEPEPATPQQTHEIIQDVVSYAKEIASASNVLQFGQELLTAVNPQELASIAQAANNFAQGPISQLPLSALAQRPLSALQQVSYPAFVTDLPANVRDDFLALATSIGVAEASIVRNVIGTAPAPAPAPAAGGGGGGGGGGNGGAAARPSSLGFQAAGAAVGALGLVAALL